jgi:hypothetical protein
MKATTRFFVRLASIGSVAFLSFCLGSPSSPSGLLYAQSVSFAGVHTKLPLESSLHPDAVAVDGAKNLFLTDRVTQALVELPWTEAGYGAQITLPATGLKNAEGLAVDNAGNVFIADTFNNHIVELIKTSTGFGPLTTLAFSGLYYPNGIAVDNVGDVFVTDSVNKRIVELPWTGTGFGRQTTLPFSDLSYPAGVAVDNAGDVFITDYTKGTVEELMKTSTGFGQQTTLPFSAWTPVGVAVDSAGNVFVVETLNNSLVELPRTGTGYGQPITLDSIPYPYHVAVDVSGNVFTATEYYVVEFQTRFANFWGANVCAPGTTTPAPCSQTLTLKFDVNAGVTFGPPHVLTGGAQDQDFTLGASTCKGTMTEGSTCKINVKFAPLAAGFRNGTVEITDSGGNVITRTLLSGFGVVETTGPPVAQVSTARLAFGTVAFGLSEALPVMVANIGGGTLTVASSINTSSGGQSHSYTIAESTCEGGVTSGSFCNLAVQFSPRSITTHDDLLTLQTNGETNPIVKLHGVANGLSVLGGVSGGSLQFGSVSSGSTEVLPLTVTNVGLPGTVTIGTAVTVRATTRPTTIYKVLTTAQNTCLAGIAAGQSCTLPVEFAPTTSGTHDDLLTLVPSLRGGSTTVWLTGSTP